MGAATPVARPRLGDRLRTILAFCLVGFCNTIVPALVFSGAYLMVPYSRPVVILIHTLPAVAGRLLFPHLLFRVPHWKRPLGVALCCAISASIIHIAPPNVSPPIRIFAVVLASVSSAAGDASWLGLLRHYEKPGLIGWGMGISAGGVACAIMPYIVTVRMGLFLRSSLGYVWYLIPTMLVAHYCILPQPLTATPLPKDADTKVDVFEMDIEDSVDLLLSRDAPAQPLGVLQRAHANARQVEKMAVPFILPLLLASAGQSIIYPGFSRAIAATPVLDTYQTFVAGYGTAFHLGNFVGRSSLAFTRTLNKKTLLMTLAFVTSLLFLNTAYSLTTSPTVLFTVVFVAGLVVGKLYIGMFASALNQMEYSSSAEREFSIGVIGVGEPVGLIVGGLVGAGVETLLCGLGLGNWERWCYTTR